MTDTPIGGTLTLHLPEPPSLNAMLALAKRRTRRTRDGGFMRRALPIVYDQHLERYEITAAAALAVAGLVPPATPWPRWSMLQAEFRLWNERDVTELLASLKWPVDVLVRRRWVADDSPRHLTATCVPTQRIARSHRGVTLVIRREP
jgi:hypothetical protein